jgi:hypothetical protein
MMTGIGLWDLYKYCRNVKDCNQRANEACQQYETPDWKQGPLGNMYDANYSRRNACINWAYNCCITQAGAGGFNILNPIPVSVVPEPTCDFSNPPGF